FLFAIDDRACLEQDGGHPRFAEHDQLVIAVNSGLSIDELPLPIAHESFGVVRRVLQPARLELIPQQPGETQTAPEIPIVDGDKNRMALKAVAEGAFAAIVLPFLHELVRHAAPIAPRSTFINPRSTRHWGAAGELLRSESTRARRRP